MVTKSTSSSPASSPTHKPKSSLKSARSFDIKDISMNNLIDKIKKADKDLDTILSKQPIILKLERQSGIKKTQMVYGLVALVKLCLLYYFVTSLVVAMVLFAYPMIMSLEAVESHDKMKDAHLLSYWSVIALVQMIEAIFPFIRLYIPFYNFLKLTLAVYMYLPQTKGSLIVYDVAFKPLLAQIKASKTGAKVSVPLKKSSSNMDSAEN